jgi:hypothetical protein
MVLDVGRIWTQLSAMDRYRSERDYIRRTVEDQERQIQDRKSATVGHDISIGIKEHSIGSMHKCLKQLEGEFENERPYKLEGEVNFEAQLRLTTTDVFNNVALNSRAKELEKGNRQR